MKTWTDDERMSATDLNAIVTTGTLVFDDAASRDATLVGELAPSPGMLTYLVTPDALGSAQQRISVDGVGYWAPPPGTFIVGVSHPASLSIVANTAVQISSMTVVKSRNMAGMWANNRFTPTIPGWYQLEGQVQYNGSLIDGYRAAWLSLNGASTATAIPGSQNQLIPQGGAYLTVPTRTVMWYFNGADGSYVTLMTQHTATTAQYSNPSGGVGVTYFSAHYLGM